MNSLLPILQTVAKKIKDSEIAESISYDFRNLFLRLNAWFHRTFPHFSVLNFVFKSKEAKYRFASALNIFLILIIVANGIKPAERFLEPLISPLRPLQTLTEEQVSNSNKGDKEVFGFAPWWNIDKLDNIDYNVLTTMAYFGTDVDGEGNLDRTSEGYQTFKSDKATEIFKKAHAHGTRVVFTVTQMDNATIRALMDNPAGQEKFINEIVDEVKGRGIDGVNIDFEYMGDPGQEYRNKYTTFISNLTNRMHSEIPGSKVSISVYASAVKDPKIYDLSDLGKLDIKVFMMAYDFGYSGSEEVIPTSPLYGHKTGTYWYDVSTAVEDFLKLMPAEKLILGNAWYGYNYAIYGQPAPKADAMGRGKAQTYKMVSEEINPNMEGISGYKEGWDDEGKVSWKAYYSNAVGAWRMVFIEDKRSLGEKYDFAKSKNLGGVGMWAMGNEDSQNQIWGLLADKFGVRDTADASIKNREIK